MTNKTQNQQKGFEHCNFAVGTRFVCPSLLVFGQYQGSSEERVHDTSCVFPVF
jgi:hypothetical protein